MLVTIVREAPTISLLIFHFPLSKMITPLNPNPTVNMFDMNTVPTSMSVPLRQCLVMSVLYGDSHQQPAALFASNLVCQVVVGVTGECP